jgi:hypothetical protein
MAKLAELFEGRFDISYGDDGVSLNCTECSATIKIPSPIEALELEDPEMDHADQIINLVKLILKHLDECKPTDE